MAQLKSLSSEVAELGWPFAKPCGRPVGDTDGSEDSSPHLQAVSGQVGGAASYLVRCLSGSHPEAKAGPCQPPSPALLAT